MIKKIVASDIDGTLLPFGQLKIKNSLLNIIGKFKDKDILFVPASGRTIDSLEKLFDPIKEDVAFLSENGGVVWRGTTPIAETPLPKELSHEIAEDIYSHEDWVAYFTTIDSAFVYGQNEKLTNFVCERFSENCRIINSLDEIEGRPVKLTVFLPCAAELMVDYFDKYKDKLNVMIAGLDVIDFGVANKGFGLKLLTEYYGLSSKDVYAFGDNYNDQSMLEYAENSYIMKTDDKVLRDSAKFECDDIEMEFKKILKN